MTADPSIEQAVANTKIKASAYNTNFTNMVNYIKACVLDMQTLVTSFIPSQTSNAGKFLTTDGTSASWVYAKDRIEALGATSSDITLTADCITTADFSETPVVTLPTLSGIAKEVTCILDFTTSDTSKPTISTTGTLRWSDKNGGKAPSAYSGLSGVRNRLTFSTIDSGANWEVEYRTYGGVETTFVQPALTANGTLGGESFAVSCTLNSANAYLASDNNNSTQWSSDSDAQFEYTLFNPTAVKASAITIKNSYSYSDRYIIGWVLYGSNDNSNWTTLNSGTNSYGQTLGTWDMSIPEGYRNYFKYYKVVGLAGGGLWRYVTQITLNGTYIAA